MGKTELYNSKVGIPNLRRTAPQINPNVARMYTGKGVGKIGEAIFAVGEDIHQINVARQVAHAAAEYKLAATEFMARMENADPSQVDFTQEFKKFQASQGGLAQGVSRDASHIITNKLAGYGASTFGDIKRMEIRNTRGMLLAEAPDILEGLVHEQVKAELTGDTERAKEAEQDYKDYIRAVSPGLRPGEITRLKSAYKDVLEKERESGVENAIVGFINKGDLVNAKSLTTACGLPEKKKYTLYNAIKAQAKKQETGSTLRKKMIKEGYARQLLDVGKTNAVLSIPDADDETRDYIDMINLATGAGIDNMLLDPPPSYYALKEDLDNLNQTPTYRKIVEVWAAGTPKDLVMDLEEQLEQNQQLLPHKAEYTAVRGLIKADFKAIENTINKKYTWRKKPEITDTLLREMDELEVYYEENLKKDLIDGKPYDEIRKNLNKAFEHTHKDVIEKWRWLVGWTKPKAKELAGVLQFAHKRESAQTAELMRAQGALHLIQSGGEHKDLIKAMVQADFFTKDIADLKPIPVETSKTKHGKATSGRDKQDGYYGSLPLHKDGEKIGYATEYSIGSADVVPGQETEIPTLVPTLEDLELIDMIENIIPNHKPIPESITDKAVAHAKMRIKAGKSPFWNPKDDVK